MAENVERFLVRPRATIEEVLEAIQEGGRGIALVVEEDGQLLDTVTDGDIRRSLMGQMDLVDPILEVIQDEGGPSEGPITARVSEGLEEIRGRLETQAVQNIHVLDDQGRVQDLVNRADLDGQGMSDVQAVVMAGGFGTRLRPLTEDTPKPMLPLDGRPLLEYIVRKLMSEGIQDITFTTHYLAETIRDHFGDGGEFDANIDYLHEQEPKGTAGFLTDLGDWERDLLVINGDVLTDASLRGAVEFHREQGADATVGVTEHDLEVPYGTLEMDGFRISGLREKPTFSFYVNAGVYVLSPSLMPLVEETQPAEMTDLLQDASRRDRRVVGFPLEGRWLDIGEPSDYKRAREEIDDFDL